ncbi:nicotinate (nicotinamide) nucleotide adenylyltransferase [Luteolibacter sp. LG18]|uniref:nicotinate (nicotinamide) nucleotide adenylyltransferase n=1 Tax=Luteolibacter sp. LG18 TaxID=2819286 RepID=UPI002B2D2781|nr:putative nicotinate-nucleotide adenylyltransferase [Luteolibacter sp. LG18]
MSEPRRIAIFGGTFDPVHLGHLHMAERAREEARLDEVRFLPCRISPHKLGSAAASGDDRLEMLRLATAGIPWATVDDYELNGPEPSYSYLTAEYMADHEPEAEWFWLMGGDQWEALPRWRHPDRLAAVMQFLVLARGHEKPQPRPGWRMQVVAGEHPASSTAIRAGKELSVEGWLSPPVAAYIRKHGLYRH